MDQNAFVKKIEYYCEEHGFRFTESRQRVCEIIAASVKPLGAYDILGELGKSTKNPKPTTVYRAIEFLEEHHFIHRIESLNAYVLCQTDHRHGGSQFMICSQCGKVIEAHLCEIPEPFRSLTEREGFVLSAWNVEINGTCRECLMDR